MPNNSHKNSSTTTYGASNQFVRWTLTRGQAEACKAAVIAPEQALDLVQELTEQGYRVSLKHDDYDGCACAFLIATAECETNAGRTLTGRGSSVYKALKQLLYAHYTLFDGVWPPDETRSATFLDD